MPRRSNRSAVQSRGIASKPAYHYNLAASLQFVGELHAAELEYRETLRLEPRFHRAWSALAKVARSPLTQVEIAALERELEEPTIDADAELHVCHALAKQHEDEGRYETAFRLLAARQAPQSRRAGLRFRRRPGAVRGCGTAAACARRPRRRGLRLARADLHRRHAPHGHDARRAHLVESPAASSRPGSSRTSAWC